MKKIIKLIKDMDKKRKVEFIICYGSYLTQKKTPMSDIDIAIFYEGDKKERFDFRMKLLGFAKDKYDIQTFQDLPLYLRAEILKKGKIIFIKESKKVSSIAIETIREYESFRKYYDLYINSIEGVKIA